MFRLEDINENVFGYGRPNHNKAYSVRYRQLQYKIASYIQTAWPFQLKFAIYIFGVVILQMKQKTKFWKIQDRAPLKRKPQISKKYQIFIKITQHRASWYIYWHELFSLM